MTFPKSLLDDYPGLGVWCILHAYRGSIAHGTYVPNSDPLSIDDKDTIALCVPSKEYYLGLKSYGSRGTAEIKWNEWDVVIYEAKKGISLLEQGNPNVLSILWLPQKHYIYNSAAGQLLLQHRRLFVGKHVYRAFTGYAYSQLHRMESFQKNGYMGEKRKQLVQKFGYDTKNAAHLIRLLRMGIEFLSSGELFVEREDAPQLLQIKRGEWSLDRVKEESDRLFSLSEEAYVRSRLPERPDREAISALCVDIVETAWKEREYKPESLLEE